MKTARYAGKTFNIPTLGQDGFSFPTLDPLNIPIFQTMNRVFDLKNFEIPRKPIVVGHGGFNNRPLGEDVRILDMPIKFPGSNYRVPLECKRFRQVIEQMAMNETLMNPLVDNYYAYLTVDSSFVKKDKAQRNTGAHVDGFQGARITEKVEADRSYILVSDFPTDFYVQSWNVKGLNPAKDNFFKAFDKQKKASKLWRPEPYDIVLMDAYTVHEAGRATEDKYRIFIRLSFSKRIFDRLGNTHNPLFDYDWNMVARDVSKSLR